MLRLVALPFVVLAFHTSIQPLPGPLRAQLAGRYWHRGCPVPLSRLRVLTVNHWGFDGRVHTGQIVVNQDAAAPLARVFRRLYELRFPIRHMRIGDAYGPALSRPADGDVTGTQKPTNACAVRLLDVALDDAARVENISGPVSVARG